MRDAVCLGIRCAVRAEKYDEGAIKTASGQVLGKMLYVFTFKGAGFLKLYS